MDDMGKIQDQLRDDIWRAMADQKLSQVELARRAGTSPATLNQYLKGNRGMLNGTTEAILEALGLSIELVPDEPVPDEK